ncbi:hypothetical protein [Burkholderia cenocepacia]|uniref:hypothetical protein n=1 Tax=Burkholderia cenocepacia TaxID=95486 RepID=UPI0013E0B9BB|nr:hypothetical protein [Burkholderia cenocepacia]MCW3585077.1 hypothetical protein [Burkholderia cenocepacia]MCW3630545.1 hypothetical protein [Burkholderia cenocepacia]MCW5178682.1 hypothetical protein [Burkholderia cenocepacia]
MKGITGFRLRRRTAANEASIRPVAALPAARFDQGAQDRVMAKITAMAEAFYVMPESEYGDWLDSLPQDEFIEFMSVMIELDDRTRRTCARST